MALDPFQVERAEKQLEEVIELLIKIVESGKVKKSDRELKQVIDKNKKILIKVMNRYKEDEEEGKKSEILEHDKKDRKNYI